MDGMRINYRRVSKYTKDYYKLYIDSAFVGGKFYSINHYPDSGMPWSIQQGHFEHHFKTLEACLAYGAGREWLRETMIDGIKCVINQNYHEIYGKYYEGE